LKVSLVYTAHGKSKSRHQHEFIARGKEMITKSAPKELIEARKKLDVIDEGLVEMLEARFQLTHQVGLLKADQKMPPLDSDREAQKIVQLRSLCEGKNLNPDFVTEVFRLVMKEVVKNHEKLRSQ
jgi:chorismate mutase